MIFCSFEVRYDAQKRAVKYAPHAVTLLTVARRLRRDSSRFGTLQIQDDEKARKINSIRRSLNVYKHRHERRHWILHCQWLRAAAVGVGR